MAGFKRKELKLNCWKKNRKCELGFKRKVWSRLGL